MLKPGSVLFKLWYFLRTYILTVPRFDLFLQGTLLILILLDANLYLLLKRDADAGFHPPSVTKWVSMGAAGAEFVFGPFLAWCGRKRRHAALSFWLTLTAVASLLVLIFPFEDPNPQGVGLCNNPAPSNVGGTDSNIAPRTTMLIIAAMLSVMAKVSIWSHGLTYLDDHEPQNGPYFVGILVSIRLSLGLSGQAWLEAGGNREDWWEAHLSLSMLTLMFAFLFTLFPKKMPNYEPPASKEDDGFLASLCRVLRNKKIIMQLVALSLLNAAIFCFVDYNPDYIEARYHIEAQRMDPRTPSLLGTIYRPMIIIFFIMIFRVRFSVRRSDGVKANTAARVGGVVAVFTAIFLVVLAVLSCGIEDIQGSSLDGYQQPACSAQCGCNTERYGFSPVCNPETSTTYFSPCHAGCSVSNEIGGLGFYTNCTCGIMEYGVQGACTLLSCRTMYTLYLCIFAVVLAVSGSSLLMQGMVLLRAVDHNDKAIAVGTGFSVMALLSQICGGLLYMLISNLTCMHEVDGVCLLHHPTLWWMPTTSAILAVLSAVVSIVASRVAYSPDEVY